MNAPTLISVDGNLLTWELRLDILHLSEGTRLYRFTTRRAGKSIRVEGKGRPAYVRTVGDTPRCAACDSTVCRHAHLARAHLSYWSRQAQPAAA